MFASVDDRARSLALRGERVWTRKSKYLVGAAGRLRRTGAQRGMEQAEQSVPVPFRSVAVVDRKPAHRKAVPYLRVDFQGVSDTGRRESVLEAILLLFGEV